MKPTTICLTYFKSLALANLEASLFSVCQQDLTGVEEIIILDNDTQDDEVAIRMLVEHLQPSCPVRVISIKHKDPSRTHSWSTNEVVRQAATPWIFFTRADYILDFRACRHFTDVVQAKEYDVQGKWNGFVTANVYHLGVDVGRCDTAEWRTHGASTLHNLPGVENDYTVIDTGVWMMRREAFDRVEGLDERLTAWGHAQTDFQYRLHKSGTEFARIPEAMFYHPLHAGERDIELAHKQLAERGIALKDLWARYTGQQVYA